MARWWRLESRPMNDETKFNSSLLFPETNLKLSFWLILRIDAVNKDYIGYLLIPITGVTITEINIHWMSQVHVAKPVAVDGLCYLNWLILSQQNVTDIINQEKQCSKFVTILVYFPKLLRFKIYENLYRIQFSLISFELVGLTWLKVYNKMSLNLLQSSWFWNQYNAASAKFIELSLCWQVANVRHITVTITIITNCTRFTKPRYTHWTIKNVTFYFWL